MIMTRIAVIDAATGVIQNVLVFQGKVPAPPHGVRYVTDRARVAAIGKVFTEQELSAEPQPEPEHDQAPTDRHLELVERVADLAAELDALKAVLIDKTAVTEADIAAHRSKP